MTISTITIGENVYMSYASLEEADAYLAVDPIRSVSWIALPDEKKNANLVAATRRMDLLNYNGELAEEDQALKWPRKNATRCGVPVSETELPIEIQNATILLAGSIELDGSVADSGGSGSNIRRVEAGSAGVEFFRPTIPGLALQDETAFRLVSCFLDGSDGSGAGYGFASGTDGKSIFGDPDYPGFERGLA